MTSSVTCMEYSVEILCPILVLTSPFPFKGFTGDIQYALYKADLVYFSREKREMRQEEGPCHLGSVKHEQKSAAGLCQKKVFQDFTQAICIPQHTI